MIVVVLSLLAGLALVVGLGAPAASEELRAGRATFRELSVRRAAEGELVRWFEGNWIAVAPTLNPGVQHDFPQDSLGARVVIERRLTRVAPDVWMLDVRAVERDRNARDLAASHQAVLIGFRQQAGDSVARPYRIARPWAQAHQ